MPKTLLKRKEVSRNHFSSRSKKLDSGQNLTRCVVRVLEAYDLLASDAETGKSDPVCFICCGHKDAQPDWNINDISSDADDGLYILRTNVVNSTLEPHWDSEHIFPLDVSDIEGLLDGKITVNVRDEDIDNNNNRSYDDLGFAEILFSDILARGKKLNETAIFDIARWYKLQKCPGMRKVDGHIKISVTFFFQEDAMELFSAVGAATPSGFINQLQSKLNNNNNNNIKPLPPQSKERSSSKLESFTVAAPRISLKSSTSTSQPLPLATLPPNQEKTRGAVRPMSSEMLHLPSSKTELLEDDVLVDDDVIMERVVLPKHHFEGAPTSVSNIMPPKTTATSNSTSSINTPNQIDNIAAANPLVSSQSHVASAGLQEKLSESSIIVSSIKTDIVPFEIPEGISTRNEGVEEVEKLSPRSSVPASLPSTDNKDTNSNSTNQPTADININEASDPASNLAMFDAAATGDMALPTEDDDGNNNVESPLTNKIKQINTGINNTTLAPSTNGTINTSEVGDGDGDGDGDHLPQPAGTMLTTASHGSGSLQTQTQTQTRTQTLVQIQTLTLINQSKQTEDLEYIENDEATNTAPAPPGSGPRKVKLKSSKSSLPESVGGNNGSSNPSIKEDSRVNSVDTSNNSSSSRNSKDHNAIRAPVIQGKPENTNTNTSSSSTAASASASRGRPKSASATATRTSATATASRSRSAERNSNNINNNNTNSSTGPGPPVTKAASKAPSSSLSSRHRSDAGSGGGTTGTGVTKRSGAGSGRSSGGATARTGGEGGLVLEKPWHKKRSRKNDSGDNNADIRIVTAGSVNIGNPEDWDAAAGGAGMLYLDEGGAGDQAFYSDDEEEEVAASAYPTAKNRATGHVTETVRTLRRDTKGNGDRGGAEDAPIRLQQENEILRVSLEELVRATKDGLRDLSQRLATVELTIVPSPSSKPTPSPLPPGVRSRNGYSVSDQEQDTDYQTRSTRPRSAGVTGRSNRYRKQPTLPNRNSYQQQQQQQQPFRAAINWVQVDQWLLQDEPYLAFGAVLDRGGTSDLAKLMLIFGSRPQELSANLRNRVFDGVATLLTQSKQIDVCLSWTLHLVRHRLVQELVRHTQRSLAEGLMHAATEDSRRGVLAARLEAEITKAMEL